MPILLPLSARYGFDTGLTYSAFAVAGLAALVLGAWSDRRRRHRTLLLGGLGFSAFAFALFPLAAGLFARLALALAAGFGVIGASTVGTTLVVETAPGGEWDQRISVLQSWISTGQVAGLVLADTLALSHARTAFEIAAAALLLGALIAWRWAPAPGEPVPQVAVPPKPVVGGEAGSSHRQFHRIGLHGLQTLLDLRPAPCCASSVFGCRSTRRRTPSRPCCRWQ